MSVSTRALIAALKAMIVPSSITPNTIGNILEATQDDIDGVLQEVSDLSQDVTDYMQTVNSTLSDHAESITNHTGRLNNIDSSITNIGSTLTTHGNSITANASDISNLKSKTNTPRDIITGDSALARVSDCVPYVVNAIDLTTYDYPLQVVELSDASLFFTDLRLIKRQVYRIIIECDDDYDLSGDLALANIMSRAGADFRLMKGNTYQLSIFRILNTAKHTTYSQQDVEFFASLIKS